MPRAASSASPRLLLRLADVCERVGLGRTRVYALQRAGRFPRAVRLSARTVGWHLHEVDAWIASRPRAGLDHAAAQALPYPTGKETHRP